MNRAFAALGLFLTSAIFADASASTYTVAIKGMRYLAPVAKLAVGDTVILKNNDIFRHTATDRSGEFDVMLEPGASVSVTLKKAGRLRIFCRYHPGMVMQLTVRNDD